jgi:Cu2+-exporting ATPase
MPAQRVPGKDAETRCFHCGEPIPARSSWREDIDGETRAFCCIGCAAVAQTIRTAGLESYYLLRQTASESARRHLPQSFESIAASAHVVQLDANAREVALLVDGIRCGACVWLIETWLGRQPGVDEVFVNFATRRARVRFDATRTNARDVLEAFARIGYHAHPYDPRRREADAHRESRSLLLRFGLAVLGMMQVMMFAVPAYITVDGVDAEYQALLNWASLVITIPVVAYCSIPFFVGAWRGLRAVRPGMDVPIALGIVGAFAVSVSGTLTGNASVYFDSVTMFVALVLGARFIELRVQSKAADALESLARDMPQEALLVDGYPYARTVRSVDASALIPGQVVRVDAGAAIPADGIVIEGHSSIEEAVLTGESWPRTRSVGDRVLAGSVNRASPLFLRVEAAGEASALGALSRLVERAASHRPRVAHLSDRIATWFVTVLLGFAVITGIAWWVIEPARAFAVTLAVLVVSCPCALSLATPAALASAAGALLRRRVLCVRSDTLERLSRVTHVVLDKTGTLTTGKVRVVGVDTVDDALQGQCISIAAQLEEGSHHPIAIALGSPVDPSLRSSDVSAITGSGVEGIVDGTRYRFGRPAWVQSFCRMPMPQGFGDAPPGEIPVALASEHRWIACIRFGDSLRCDAPTLVRQLHALGLRISIVSGDREASVAHIARVLGIDDWCAEARPDDKQRIIADLQRTGAVVAMVGDGINDAPSLAGADVSLTLGNAATLTQWVADGVVLGDRLDRIGLAFRVARRTFRVIRQNVAWALIYNAIAIPLAAVGQLSPLTAAVGMSLSSLIVVGNAWRLSRIQDDVEKGVRPLEAPGLTCASNAPLPVWVAEASNG